MSLSFRAAFLAIAAAMFVMCCFPLAKPHRAPLADFTPGLRYDAGPYRAPDGCVSRRWRVGEFMPWACARGQEMKGDVIGLQYDGTMVRSARTAPEYRWVRAGPDVLLVDCPFTTACQVFQVVADRFAPKPADSPAAEVDDPQALRIAPPAYRMTRWVHRILLIPMGLFLLLAALSPYPASPRLSQARAGLDDEP